MKKLLNQLLSKLTKLKTEIIWLKIQIKHLLKIRDKQIVVLEERTVFNESDHVLIGKEKLSKDKTGKYLEGVVVGYTKPHYKVSITNYRGQHQNYNASDLNLIITKKVTEKEHIIHYFKVQNAGLQK